MLAMIQRSSEIVVLPVHDSFIVHHGYKDELVAMMLGAYCLKYGYIPPPRLSKEMVVEVTGVPEWGSWCSQPVNHDNLLDVVSLAGMVPSERRLEFFRSFSRQL